jgi:hypothetical protein
VLLAAADNLGTERGLCALAQVLVVLLHDVELLLHFEDSFDGNFAGLVESISYFERVDTLVKQFISLIEDSTCEDDDSSCAVTDFVVLRS